MIVLRTLMMMILTYRGLLSKVTGRLDRRSSNGEKVVTIDLEMTDICEEMYFTLPCTLGAMPQCILTRPRVQTYPRRWRRAPRMASMT